jgi:hypothetical protein
MSAHDLVRWFYFSSRVEVLPKISEDGTLVQSFHSSSLEEQSKEERSRTWRFPLLLLLLLSTW